MEETTFRSTNAKQQKIKNLPTENDSEEKMNVIFHANVNTSAVGTCEAR